MKRERRRSGSQEEWSATGAAFVLFWRESVGRPHCPWANIFLTESVLLCTDVLPPSIALSLFLSQASLSRSLSGSLSLSRLPPSLATSFSSFSLSVFLNLSITLSLYISPYLLSIPILFLSPQDLLLSCRSSSSHSWSFWFLFFSFV